MAFILLSSAKHDAPNTRSFNEFKTTEDLAKALVNHFEEYLLTRERCETGITTDDNSLEYKSDQLYKFLDDFFGELCCLARQEDDPNLWIPYPKDWVKENCIYIYLRGQHERALKEAAAQARPPLGDGGLAVHTNLAIAPAKSIDNIINRGSLGMDIDGVHG
uniref:Enhancer of rudimentary n=1 Tax=Aceria tosichella TaxID=561515 RepID=A0A6G1SEG2_9ACAR